MILQSTDELEERVGNKYSLVIVSAKRARQLKEGHNALTLDSSENPLSVALREIQDDKVRPVAPPEEEIAPAPRDVISSLVAGAEFGLDEDLDLEDGDAVDDLAALLVGADEEDEEEETEVDDVLTPVAAVDEVDSEVEDDAEAEEETDDVEEETEDDAEADDTEE
jgi:DNA-directed RNA polymerase subunit omega